MKTAAQFAQATLQLDNSIGFTPSVERFELIRWLPFAPAHEPSTFETFVLPIWSTSALLYLQIEWRGAKSTSHNGIFTAGHFARGLPNSRCLGRRLVSTQKPTLPTRIRAEKSGEVPAAWAAGLMCSRCFNSGNGSPPVTNRPRSYISASNVPFSKN
jgi:hypothetical protein